MGSWIRIEPSYRELLAANDLDSFEKIMSWRGGQVESKHRLRDTVRVLLFEGEKPLVAYLKRNYSIPAKHILLDWLAGRRAKGQPVKEALAIDLIRRREVGVMETLAYGQETRFGWPARAFLLVKAAASDRSIDDWIKELSSENESEDRQRRRSRLFRQLGGFISRIHRSELSVPDLVMKHIFVAETSASDDDKQPSFCFELIDVERASHCDDKKRLQSELHDFLRDLSSSGVTRSDFLRLALGYFDSAETREERIALIRRRLDELGEIPRFLRRRRTAAGPSNAIDGRPDQFVRFGNARINKSYIPLLQHNGLTSFAKLAAFQNGVELKKPGLGRRRRMRAELETLDGETLVVYAKIYKRPPLGAQLKRIFAGRALKGTADAEFRAIRAVADAAVPTMRPIAVGQSMRGPIEKYSFLVTEAVGGKSLESWANQGPKQREIDQADRRYGARVLGELVRRLHDASLYHRDLYFSHVFLDRDEGGAIVFRLIDLQRVIRPLLRRRRWAVKDLAALEYSAPYPLVSATDRVRFLCAYLGVERLGPAGRRLMLRVRGKAARIARHNRLKN
jgi:hypothetical protein